MRGFLPPPTQNVPVSSAIILTADSSANRSGFPLVLAVIKVRSVGKVNAAGIGSPMCSISASPAALFPTVAGRNSDSSCSSTSWI